MPLLATDRMFQAVVNVILNQRLFCLLYGSFHCMQLLSDTKARLAFFQHGNDARQVAICPFEALDQRGVACMNVWLCHGGWLQKLYEKSVIRIPPGGMLEFANYVPPSQWTTSFLAATTIAACLSQHRAFAPPQVASSARAVLADSEHAAVQLGAFPVPRHGTTGGRNFWLRTC